MTTLQKLIPQKKQPALALLGESEKPKAKSRTSQKRPNSKSSVSDEERRKMIATNAYYRAQSRNFSPEGQEADWLAAEEEINGILGIAHWQ